MPTLPFKPHPVTITIAGRLGTGRSSLLVRIMRILSKAGIPCSHNEVDLPLVTNKKAKFILKSLGHGQRITVDLRIVTLIDNILDPGAVKVARPVSQGPVRLRRLRRSKK